MLSKFCSVPAVAGQPSNCGPSHTQTLQYELPQVDTSPKQALCCSPNQKKHFSSRAESNNTLSDFSGQNFIFRKLLVLSGQIKVF